jgi:hypothetical protein
MVIIFQMLARKVETLTKAMEVEAKKMRREVAVMEKEVAAMRTDKEQETKAKRFSNVKGPMNSAQQQLVSGRYFFFSFYGHILVLFIQRSTMLAFFCK